MQAESDQQVESDRTPAAGSTPGGGETQVTWRLWPALAILGAAIVLTAFGLWSQTIFINGRSLFAGMPIYGLFQPVFSPLAWTVVPAGLLLAGVAWAVTSYRRVPSWLALALIILCGVATSVAINVVRGQPDELIKGVSLDPGGVFYTADLHFVDQYGIRGFVEHYPTLSPQLHSYNGRTHPPGVQVFLWLVYKAVGVGHPFRFTTALAIIAMAAAIGAYALGRAYGGERAGRIAAALVVATPAFLLLSYTNMDVIFAALFALAAAACVIGARRRSIALMAGAGAVLGLTTFLTYATAFLALAMVVAVVVETRRVWPAVRLLAAAGVGGIVILAILRVAVGFDLLASYHALPGSGGPYYPYFIAGHPAAMLIFAGLPLAALGVAGLVVKSPGACRPILPLVLTAAMIVWGTLPPHVNGLRQGEVERTWAFLYPLLAASAGPVIDRWTTSTRVKRVWGGVIVAGLVLLSVIQAGVIQALWDNIF